MPHRDVEKRRATYMRWWDKNKVRHKAYRRILKIAQKTNSIPQICIIDLCSNLGERHHPDYSKPERIIWICKKHHRTTYHTGTQRAHTTNTTKCSLCDGKVKARGWCNKHYKSERKKIDPAFATMEKIRRERSRKNRVKPS